MTLPDATAVEAGRRLLWDLVEAVSKDAGGPPRLCDPLDVLALSVTALGEGLDALPDHGLRQMYDSTVLQRMLADLAWAPGR